MVPPAREAESFYYSSAWETVLAKARAYRG
jgi:hypothetical protein